MKNRVVFGADAQLESHDHISGTLSELPIFLMVLVTENYEKIISFIYFY